MWNNNVFKQKQDGMYESTVKSLEKAKEILNQRLANRTITDDEYMKKVKELDAQIQKYKTMIN